MKNIKIAHTNCDIIIVAPDESPVKKFNGNLITLYTESIATNMSVPANCPIIKASVIVYNAWNIVLKNMGNANFISTFHTIYKFKALATFLHYTFPLK